MAQRLTPEDRAGALATLLDDGWQMVQGRDAIQKQFVFKNFVQAFAWMTQVAMWSEKLNHHPEWSNVYTTVNVTLTTHDTNGLTALDIKLAQKMDALA